MFRYGDESKELREEYNFGVGDESTTNRNNESANADPRDVHVAINRPSSTLEDYSPREETHAGFPTSPQAFGPSDSTYDTPAVNAQPHHVPPPKATEKEHHHDGKKMHVLKEVIGVNKKSTKGKSDEEKQQIMLEQRWKNAMKEEERLTELERRVSAGEVRTEMVSTPPNFPRKFLCIHPLVYHSFSAVPPQRQRFVMMAFWDWVAVSILLVLNCGFAGGIPFAPVQKNDTGKKDFNKALNLILACVYLVGIPLAFLFWYWRVYRACTSGRPSQHIVALSGLLISLAQAIFAFIGPKNYGVCGIIMTVWVGKTRSQGLLAPLVIMIFLWLAQAVFTCYLIVRQFIFYRKDLAARRAARRTAPPVIG